MIPLYLSLGALVAVVCGLDRTALLQCMISRPIVAAPLVGFLLGESAIGLQIGVLTELLWLARLPVGAAVPPDDTQIAIAATTATVILGASLNAQRLELILLVLFVCFPVARIGQLCDHYARQYNDRLVPLFDDAIESGSFHRIGRLHFRGLLSFTASALTTYCVVVCAALLLVPLLWPLVQDALLFSSSWLALALPLVGVAVILGTINVSRALSLFCAAFGMAFLMLWLV